MKNYLYILFFSLLLVSCISSTERAEIKKAAYEKQLKQDKLTCSNYGLKQGTSSFTNCMMKLDFQRKKMAGIRKQRECDAQRRENAESQARASSNIGNVLIGMAEAQMEIWACDPER